MRVLFLDIDGVLNSRRFYRSVAEALGRDDGLHLRPFDDEQLDPEAVPRLERVVTTTDCQIVISSAWRKAMTLGAIMRVLRRSGLSQGWENIIDKTGVVFEKYSRGKEIAQWLFIHRRMSTQDQVTSYAIVDDDFDAGSGVHAKYFVRTTFDDGLLDEHAEKLIQILQGDGR